MHRAAVGQLGTLREAGRARRVEDRGVVVGVDVGRGQLGRRSGGGHDVRPADAVGGQVAIGAHRDERERVLRAEAVEHGQDALDALVVGDQHLGARVVRPYSISGVVHHAFSPTTAAPSDVIAQYPTTHSG